MLAHLHLFQPDSSARFFVREARDVLEDVARHRLAPHGGQDAQSRESEVRDVPEFGE